MKSRSGQVLIGVLLLLMVLMIIVPAMVVYVQHEAKWSGKESETTNAFQLAEAAVDRGYQKVTESTTTWQSFQSGTQTAGYHLDSDGASALESFRRNYRRRATFVE